MDLIKNYRIHLAAIIIVVIAEMIGTQRFGLIIFLPLLYALVLGTIVSYPALKILTNPQMERASHILGISMLLLIAKLGLDIGPNLHMILNSGWALIFQELGHFFGTLVFGLPVALLVRMKREAIGAVYRTSPSLPSASASIRPKGAASWACTSAARSSARFGCRSSRASSLRRASSTRIRSPWARASAAAR